MSEERQGVFDKVFEVWWGKVFIGAVVILFGLFEFRNLSQLESGEKDSLLVSRRTKVIYDLGGKWGIVGVTGVLGAGFVGWGAVQAVKKQ